MKKKYVKATLEIIAFSNYDVITTSGVNQLKYNEGSGKGDSESFSSMFGSK